MVRSVTHTNTYAPLTVQTEKEELERRHAEARAALRNHDHDLHKASVTVGVADAVRRRQGRRAGGDVEGGEGRGEEGAGGRAGAGGARRSRRARDKVTALAEPLKVARGAAEKQGERLRALQTETVRARALLTSAWCMSA